MNTLIFTACILITCAATVMFSITFFGAYDDPRSIVVYLTLIGICLLWAALIAWLINRRSEEYYLPLRVEE